MSKQTNKKVVRGRPFLKGQSGNPGGRPAIDPQFVELAKTKSLVALEKVVDIIEGKVKRVPKIVYLKACELVMAYGVGKPVETVDFKDLTPKQPKKIIFEFVKPNHGHTKKK